MIYNKDNRLDEDDDNDLWDDDLDLSSEPADEVGRTESDWTENYNPDEYEESLAQPDADGQDYADNHDDADDNGTTDEPEDYYSEPEPEPQQEPKPEPKSRRERFFGKASDDEGNDFYDSDAEPEPAPVKKPKAPKLDPEDPDYWIEEESGLSSILPKPRKRWKWWLAGIVILLGLIIWAWIWFFRPYADSAVKYGYIRDMERRGSIIKTFEGTMIPYKELGDPNPMQFEILPFSVESDSLAAVMKRMMLNCVPVRVEYEMYHTPLPWKGEAHMVIIKADSADTNKILPPDYRR